MADIDVRKLAAEIKAAQDGRKTLQPIAARVPGFDVAQAYAVAQLVHEARMAEGAKPVGRKIGFTNPAIWDTYGVHEPIWGFVYDSTVVQLGGERATCRIGRFAEPKIEPEIVLHFAAAPSAGARPAEILACVDWVAHGFEIVQSHYPGWKFSVADTIANSALHATLLVGPQRPVAEIAKDGVAALESLSLSLSCNGKEREVGRGSNVLGSPLLAIAHLASVLAKQPGYAPLQAGELVTTGTITAAYDIRPGETWQSELRGIVLPGLTLDFVE
jgi:2-oxo-3-hexenedioate decarboxylase